MQAIAYIFYTGIDLFVLVMLIMIVMSWLIAFNVINRGNQIVDSLWRATNALTEPLLRPIRKMMPDLGGLDLSPVVLLIGLQALRIFAEAYVFGPLVRQGF